MASPALASTNPVLSMTPTNSRCRNCGKPLYRDVFEFWCHENHRYRCDGLYYTGSERSGVIAEPETEVDKVTRILSNYGDNDL